MANYSSLASELRQKLGYDQVITDELLCEVLAVDASMYQLTPKVIVKARSASEVSEVLKSCQTHKAPLTFRAAGTSLAGQAITDSVLLMMDDGWTQIKVLDEGERVYAQPGVIGAHVNRKLAPYQKKIGPDPASIDSCMIGGIAANNASGMCCGSAQNTYQTMSSMQFILADGTRVNSADLVSVDQFKNSHAELLARLHELGKQTRADQPLADMIRHKYRLKNTTGFSLNSLVDYEDPLDILTHLLIGSEGCLGFISGITYDTVPDYRMKATALYLFPKLESACQWVVDNQQLQTNAIELMDNKALASVPQQLTGLIQPAAGEVALLIECQAETLAELENQVANVTSSLSGTDSTQHVTFTTDNPTRNKLWAIRKGIAPSIASTRRANTSVIIEDIAFPVPKLAEGIKRMSDIFMNNHYLDISIVGHAKDGNLHFIIANDFANDNEISQFSALLKDMAELVVSFGGSLKAEHGTGRNMAPYVEKEWGSKAYELMQEIKTLFDPDNLLNPGVILNEDKEVHVKNLKQLPIAHPMVDQCMECGLCESVCPTTKLSLTPRQRIVMARTRERLAESDQTPEQIKQLQHCDQLFSKLAVDSCATTSMCKTKCPVGIDTGEFILEQKQRRPSVTARLMSWLAPVHGLGIVTAKLFLRGRHWLVDKGLQTHSIIPNAPKSVELNRKSSAQKGIYFSTCTERTFSNDKTNSNGKEIIEVLNSLMVKADIELVNVTKLNHCCGLPYKSQGLFNTAESKALKLADHLQQISENGKHPIVFDASPCVQQVLSYLPKSVKTYEACDYVNQFVIPKITVRPVAETVALHVPCSSSKMGLRDTLISLAERCAEEVVVPKDIDCCGFAGSKGFTQPELNQHALRTLKKQLPRRVKRGFSNSGSCEIGLTNNAEIPYQSLLYLVDEASESTSKTALKN